MANFRMLKNENQHIITNVKKDYPADQAGIRDGEYLLEAHILKFFYFYIESVFGIQF